MNTAVILWGAEFGLRRVGDRQGYRRKNFFAKGAV